MTPDELYEAVAVDLLPELPDTSTCMDGYDWMERVRAERTGWREVAGTADGRMLGNWPYQAVAFYNDDERSLYGLAVYTEGDVHVEGFRNKTARNKAATDYQEGEDS